MTKGTIISDTRTLSPLCHEARQRTPQEFNTYNKVVHMSRQAIERRQTL